MNLLNIDIWIAPLKAVWLDIAGYAPKLIVALFILLAGLFLAWVIRRIARTIFKWMKLDEKLEGVWIFRLWSKEVHGHRPSEIGANFSFYLVLFISLLVTFRIIGGDLGESILRALLDLIPRVFSFMLILFLGSLMAMLFSAVAQLILVGFKIQRSNFWAKIIAWGTFSIAIMFSLQQLGIAGKLLTLLVLIFLSAMGLALGLAFGLGCKDLAREFLIELIKEKKSGSKE